MQSGKKWWLLGAIALVLIVGLALGIFFFLAPDSTTSLRPGGLITGVDGVSVAAPRGALEHRIDIFIEQVEDPRLEVPFPGFLEGLEVVGNFYEITASEEYWSDEMDLLFGLPIPEGASPDKLAMVGLSPTWALITGCDDPSQRWDILFGAYDPQSSLFGILLPYVGSSPLIFALVEWEDYCFGEEDEQIAAVIYDPHHEVAGLAPWHDQMLLASVNPQALTSSLVQGYPTPEIAQLSDSSISNFIVIPVGFGPGECPPEHISATRDALMVAHEAYRSLGFKEPRLNTSILYSINFEEGEFEYEWSYIYHLRKGEEGDHSGRYNCVFKTAYTRYPGYPEEPEDKITQHELFHAVQYAYDAILYNAIVNISCNYGLVEGTATLADASLDLPLVRSDWWPVLSTTSRLFTGFLDIGAYYPPRPFDYSHQDFWVYLGKRMNPVEPRLNFLIPLFQKGESLSDVNEWLEEEGTFQSLNDALWQWTKDQAFEKQVMLDTSTPQGNPGEWSGHGSISDRISISPTSQWHEGGSGDFSVSSDNYFMIYKRPRVYNIILEPGEAAYMAKIYPKIEYGAEYSQVSPIYPELLYKFYHMPARSLSYTLDEARENKPHNFRVYDEEVEAFLLIFPKQPGYGFNIKFVADISMLPPPKTLNVRSSGASQANVSTFYIKDRDGSYQTFSELTNYTLSGIKADTEVMLYATAPNTIPPVVFSHWSGAAESTNPLISLSMNQDVTVTAHFKVKPSVIAEPPPPELEVLPPLPSLIDYRLTVNTPPLLHLTREGDFPGVDISSNTGHGGKTNYTLLTIRDGTQVHLKAPVHIGTGAERFRFERWSGAVESNNREIAFNMDEDKTVTAHYIADPEVIKEPDDPVKPPANYTLWVSSSADDPSMKIGVDIISKTGHGGRTPYTIKDIQAGSEVHLEAPMSTTQAGRFTRWSGAVSGTNRSITFTMDADKKVKADYWIDLF